MRARRMAAFIAAAALVASMSCLLPAAPAGALTQPFSLKWGTFGAGDGQFNSPRGVAFDAAGNVFVADRTNNRIQVFSPTGVFIRTIGTQGTGNGQLSAPNDVAVDAATGTVYVADTLNDRIQEFTSTGTFIRKFGTTGSADGELSGPLGLSVGSSGSVYVADTGNNRIQHLGVNGTFFRKWGTIGVGDGQFQSPRDVVYDPFFADVYVADATNHRVQRFSNVGVFETKWGASGSANGQFNSPRALSVDPVSHEIVVADTLNDRLQRFDQSGAFKEVIGSSGTGNGQFTRPEGVGIDAFGNLFGADTMNNRIERFGSVVAPLPLVADWASGSSPRQPGVDLAGNVYVPSGLKIRKFAPDGALLGEITVAATAAEAPEAVAVESSGNLYVARPGSIGVFSPAGTLLRTIGAGDELQTPNGVVLSPMNGNVYFTDFGTGLVREYTNGGLFVTKWAAPNPRGIGVDANGILYVSSEADRIDRFSVTGSLLASFGTGGSGIGQFGVARGVAVDPQGDVLVVDSVNNRLQEFSPTGTLLSHRSGFSGPLGVAADGRGNVYVSDTGNTRIERFATSGTLSGNVSGGGLGGLYVVALQVGSFGVARGAFTNGSGHYAMTLPPGRYVVGFIDPLGTHTFEWFNDKTNIDSLGDTDFVNVPAGGTVTVNAAVASNGIAPPPSGATVSGTVSGPAGGVPGAFVYATDLNTGRSKGAQANASGQYSITGLHPGNGYRVIFIDPTNATLAEWFDNRAQTDLGNAQVFSLAAGSTTTLSPTLADNPTF